MNAVEFTTKIEQGVIQLPVNMQSYNNRQVRIIILTEDVEIKPSKKEKLLLAIQNMEGKNMFSDIENPVDWQKNMRNDWE